MPLHPEQLSDHVRQHGPYLHHVTSARCIDDIVREGLKPGGADGRSNYDDFFQARAGHVYLMGLELTPMVPVADERALVRVDLRHLRPELFGSDEDTVQGAALRGERWVASDPPARRMDENEREAAGQVGQLAAWAESAGIDEPEVVARSLGERRVAYRGVVPAAALVADAPPSESVQRFHERAVGELGVEAGALPPLPAIGFSATEVARARAMTLALIEAALRAGTSAVPTDVVSVADRHHAVPLANRLAKEGRAINRAGEFERAAVLLRAGELACAAGELEHLGWPDDRRTCLQLADHAVAVVASIARHGTRDDALAAAADALRRASRAAPPPGAAQAP